MNIAIVDYGMGNPGSILNMLKYLGIEAELTNNPDDLFRAKKIILPGVGAFDNGMTNLNKFGWFEPLNSLVINEKVPILGICLGMQLMTLSSDEGSLSGFGWIDAETKHFSYNQPNNIKVPHIGWNRVQLTQKHLLTDGLDEQTKFYFVHSYRVLCRQQNDSLATTSYGSPFDSIFARENIYGCQFHPEKSHKHGMKIFVNFNKL